MFLQSETSETPVVVHAKAEVLVRWHQENHNTLTLGKTLDKGMKVLQRDAGSGHWNSRAMHRRQKRHVVVVVVVIVVSGDGSLLRWHQDRTTSVIGVGQGSVAAGKAPYTAKQQRHDTARHDDEAAWQVLGPLIYSPPWFCLVLFFFFQHS